MRRPRKISLTSKLTRAPRGGMPINTALPPGAVIAIAASTVGTSPAHSNA